MKYIILLVMIILLVIPVSGIEISPNTIDKINHDFMEINSSFMSVEKGFENYSRNIWHNGKPRMQDKILASIGNTMSHSKPYLPLTKWPLNITEIQLNLEMDEDILQNATKNYNGSANYLKRYGTAYGWNESIIYGDMDTGEILVCRVGEYGSVYSGNIPKRDNMIVLHTHPDIFPGITGVYDPVFSYGDITGFASDYNAGIRWEGVISSNGIAITNINPINNITKSHNYYSGEYNLIDDIMERYNQKDRFANDGMDIRIYEWL